MKGDYGKVKIRIKPIPEKWARVEYHKPFTYYYDDDGHCRGMIHDYYDEWLHHIPKEARREA